MDDGCHSESSGKNSHDDDIKGSSKKKSFKAGVRCCSDEVYSKDCTTIGKCPADATTYDDAALQCNDNGRRLCTKDELLKDLCCGTGGDCDSHAVWTKRKLVLLILMSLLFIVRV